MKSISKYMFVDSIDQNSPISVWYVILYLSASWSAVFSDINLFLLITKNHWTSIEFVMPSSYIPFIAWSLLVLAVCMGVIYKLCSASVAFVIVYVVFWSALFFWKTLTVERIDYKSRVSSISAGFVKKC